MNMVNLKINNVPCQAPEGSTILEAAHAVGITIPTLCYFCLLYTSPSPRDRTRSRMPSSA